MSGKAEGAAKARPGRARRLRRGLVAVGAGGLVAYLLWLVLWFAPTPMQPTVDPVADSADLIVVLTGGEGRVSLGVDLLAQGVAPQLLVSGVFDSMSDERFIETWRESENLFACCITLGRQARDTRGNAQETAGWLEDHGGSRVLLVTSDYHLRRALLEFDGHLAPDIEITARPVFTNRRNLKVVAETVAESFKYLLTLVGGSRFGPWQFASVMSV